MKYKTSDNLNLISPEQCEMIRLHYNAFQNAMIIMMRWYQFNCHKNELSKLISIIVEEKADDQIFLRHLDIYRNINENNNIDTWRIEIDFVIKLSVMSKEKYSIDIIDDKDIDPKYNMGDINTKALYDWAKKYNLSVIMNTFKRLK